MKDKDFKTKIVDGICHNFNNPLTIIRCNAEQVALTSPEHQKQLNQICEQVDRMTEVIKSLRVYCGNFCVSQTESISCLLFRIQESFSSVKFQFEIMENHIVPSNLFLALHNVTLNAVEAGPEEAVIFEVFESENKLHFKITNETKVDLNKLKEPFYTEKSYSSNLGLGFNIAQEIVKTLNGTISVNNDENTTVEVVIPV